eukprot:966290-Pleurochrysis_carterae.AAC.2
MDGLPLENSGGQGTASSHWEKRVMYGEVRERERGREGCVKGREGESGVRERERERDACVCV